MVSSATLRQCRKAAGVSLKETEQLAQMRGMFISSTRISLAETGQLELQESELHLLKTVYLSQISDNLQTVLPELLDHLMRDEIVIPPNVRAHV